MFNLFVRYFIRLRIPYTVIWNDTFLAASVKLGWKQSAKMFRLKKHEVREIKIILKYLSAHN